MSLFTRALVYLFFALFSTVAILMLAQGEYKLAGFTALPATLGFLMMIEVRFPGKYALRKPDSAADTLLGRLRQFRKDHPGWDGTAWLALLVPILTLNLAQAVFWLLQVIWRLSKT